MNRVQTLIACTVSESFGDGNLDPFSDVEICLPKAAESGNLMSFTIMSGSALSAQNTIDLIVDDVIAFVRDEEASKVTFRSKKLSHGLTRIFTELH
jgi:hypothetical protein